MTQLEYKKQIESIENRAKMQKYALLRQFADEHKIQPGYVVEDYIGKARIIKVVNVYDWGEVNIEWEAENLTKSGTVNKREPTRKVYLSNIKNIGG